MTFTKKDLVETVQHGCGFTRKDSCRLVDELLGTIKGALENGEDVLISGFGKFCVKDKNGRRGRNPATGEDMMLDQRKVVRFKCSGVLKDKINGTG
jgi:integration host factor subunit alpha